MQRASHWLFFFVAWKIHWSKYSWHSYRSHWLRSLGRSPSRSRYRIISGSLCPRSSSPPHEYTAWSSDCQGRKESSFRSTWITTQILRNRTEIKETVSYENWIILSIINYAYLDRFFLRDLILITSQSNGWTENGCTSSVEKRFRLCSTRCQSNFASHGTNTIGEVSCSSISRWRGSRWRCWSRRITKGRFSHSGKENRLHFQSLIGKLAVLAVSS